MPTAQMNLTVPELVADFVQKGPLNTALTDTARLADADLTFGGPSQTAPAGAPGAADAVELPIQYRGRRMGRLVYRPDGNAPSIARAATAMTALLDHALEREMAISDLAGAMTTSYEELNMLHSLLADIAARTDAAEIGELVVDEVGRVLNCQRVSLLVLDETRENLRVLAARGLPPEAHSFSVPMDDSVAGRVFLEEGLLLVEDISNRPDLAVLSRGTYESESFAIVRVPLSARGEPVGVLSATERSGAAEFTTRDCTLFQGLASIGASALLNCRLHAAVSEQMLSTIQALASAVDAKDHYTHDHSTRVAELCVAAARHMGITDAATCREVELAGLLHDIGKIGIPDRILSKTGRLTPDEYRIVKTHVHIGAGIVEHVQGLERVAKAILHHHERYDGLGYPCGLAGDTIPLDSKLISAADVYDTLTSDRPYRSSVTPDEAIRELRRCKGSQQDPAVVEALIAVVTQEMKRSSPAAEEPVPA